MFSKSANGSELETSEKPWQEPDCQIARLESSWFWKKKLQRHEISVSIEFFDLRLRDKKEKESLCCNCCCCCCWRCCCCYCCCCCCWCCCWRRRRRETWWWWRSDLLLFIILVESYFSSRSVKKKRQMLKNRRPANFVNSSTLTLLPTSASASVSGPTLSL